MISGVSQDRFLLGVYSLLACLLLIGPFAPVAAGPTSTGAGECSSPISEHLCRIAEIDRGLFSVLGGKNLALALEMAERDRIFVHLLDPENSVVGEAREKADQRGLFGRSVNIEKSRLDKLPYADNTVDLVLAAHLSEHDLAKLSLSEILRVLRPRGKAVLGRLDEPGTQGGTLNVNQIRSWLNSAGEAKWRIVDDKLGVWAVLTKPAMKGADDWSHWEHGPDNNPVSKDTAIKAPYMTQFLGLPYYNSMPMITTVAQGRTFTAMGHIAHHRREEPWLNTLIAQNGYNGMELWRRKLPDGYLVHRSAFVAAGDNFYMINSEGNGCLILDPETGAEKHRIYIPEQLGEWKWMAIQDGVLYALLGEEQDPPQTTIVRSPGICWSWDDLSSGYYEERIPWGFGNTLIAWHLDKRKLLWKHREEAGIDSRALVMGAGNIFYYCPDSHLGSLNVVTGKVVWTNHDANIRELIEEPGIGLKSTPGWRTSCFSLYTPQALFYEAQTRMNIVAVSNRDGSLLWYRKKTTNSPNMLYTDGKLVAGIGPGGNTQEIDPLTGETLADLGFRKLGCARLTACRDSYFCRGGGEGLVRYDRLAKKTLFNGAIRPSCNDGVIPANGLLYIGPWACDCNLSLLGRAVLCSAADFDFNRLADEAAKLELLRKDPLNVAPFEITEKDWPTYRANNARTACSRATVPAEVMQSWRFTFRKPFKPTAPTAAGGLVFIGGDDYKLRAIDVETGRMKWTFLADGPVLQPPTLWRGRAYFGCGDGFIYVLEAATGEPLWRFRVSAVERKIMVYGSLCSTWPVNSGVLIKDGTAYAAAGIIDYDGTCVCALDAINGKIKWQNTNSGHLDKEVRKGVSAQGMLTVSGDRLWMPGGNVVPPASYDLATGKYYGKLVAGGRPRYFINRGEEIGVLNEHYLIQGGRLHFSATKNTVSPGKFTVLDLSGDWQAGEGMKLCNGKISPAWDERQLVMADGLYSKPACYSFDSIEKLLAGGNPASDWISEKEASGRSKAWSFLPRFGDWTTGKDLSVWLRESDTVSLAMAGNAVVEVYRTRMARGGNDRWTLHALDRNSGDVIWEQPLNSHALPGGLLISREGSVVVVMQDGTVNCFADKEGS
jgi:outer membrane protein assembly factor BamB